MSLKSHINEEFGANSMSRDTDNLIINNTLDKSSGLMVNSGKAGAIPAQWSNSPTLSGGGTTSAFGNNPKKKKDYILSYKDFLKEIKNKKIKK